MSQSRDRKSCEESMKFRSLQGKARCSGGRGPSPKISVVREIDAGRTCVCKVKAATEAQNISSDVTTRSIGDRKRLKVLKSEAGALLTSRAKRGQLGSSDVVDGGGVRAIFTRRMLQQLWERTPEPWWLITADRRVQFTSSSIPGRCCCCCYWPASSILSVGRQS